MEIKVSKCAESSCIDDCGEKGATIDVPLELGHIKRVSPQNGQQEPKHAGCY